jgi:hypothetical protein
MTGRKRIVGHMNVTQLGTRHGPAGYRQRGSDHPALNCRTKRPQSGRLPPLLIVELLDALDVEQAVSPTSDARLFEVAAMADESRGHVRNLVNHAGAGTQIAVASNRRDYSRRLSRARPGPTLVQWWCSDR